MDNDFDDFEDFEDSDDFEVQNPPPDFATLERWRIENRDTNILGCLVLIILLIVVVSVVGAKYGV